MNPPMVGVQAARTPDSGARAAPVPTGIVALLDGLGAVALLTRDAVRAALARPPEWRTVLVQLEQVGWRSHRAPLGGAGERSEEHTSELQSRGHLVCRLPLEKKYS